MLLEPARTELRRSTTWLRLLPEVLTLAGGQGHLVLHAERPWASATFSGTRHTITLEFPGAAAVAAGEALIDALPDHEFNVAGQLVADASVTEVQHAALPQPALTVTVELLLLDEG